ncbi:hypothetical protein ACFOOM_15745 [Streptomyces echinoruber]|uniref:Uncharacterized protein n=1 Tax=Streptomyces echinoruber TaxID=68898 RepID=A0A918V9H1_9ACTN|nr:hypothetical protein [Streptomyces echinoruber]GGZ81494.1 hypothetical protein GCM10010389_19050 [Streptomyces echinoruber]
MTVYGRAELLGSRTVLAASASGRPGRSCGAPTRWAPACRAAACRAGWRRSSAPRPTAVPTEEPQPAPLCAHRDVVNVRDVAEAVLVAAERPVAGRVFTFGCFTLGCFTLGRGRAVGVRAGRSTA